MKLALIGNSHLAALKLGWDQIGGTDGVEATFFGAAKTQIAPWKREGDVIYPFAANARSSFLATAGTKGVRLDFDAYVVVGMRFSFPDMSGLVRSHRTVGNLTSRRQHLVSADFLRACVEAMAAESYAASTIEVLRQTGAPVLFIPCPYLSDPFRFEAVADHLRHPRQMAEVFALYQQALDRLDCIVVRQPEQTVIDDMFTRAEYGIPGDHVHMNAAFGAHLAREILERLPERGPIAKGPPGGGPSDQPSSCGKMVGATGFEPATP